MAAPLNTDVSIVDYLKSTGQDSSYAARAKLAADNGVTGYNGTADQNTSLLGALKNKTPVPPPSTTNNGATAAGNAPITTTNLETGTSLPDPTVLAGAQANDPTLSDKITTLTKTVFNSNQAAIDNLKAAQEAQIKAQKDAEQTAVNDATAGIQKITNSTELQDTLKKINDQFKVPEQIAQLSEINAKMAAATDALNTGLIYENGRSARQQLVTGRMNTLKTQGLATMGALQGVASVIQGNLNLAKSYAESTLGAIKDDNARSLSALTTLLDLHENKLVELTKEEQGVITDRIKTISDQIKTLEDNKNDIQDFMVKYPSAFLKGGVTLTDTKAEALQKMLPILAETERLKLAKELQTKAGVTTDSTKDKSLLLQAKANGLKYDEAILAFADTLTPAYINSVYPEESKRAATLADPQKAVTDQYYANFIDPATGKVKEGTTLQYDAKSGRINPVSTSNKRGYFAGLWAGITGNN